MSPRSDVDLDNQHRSHRECATLVSRSYAVALRMLIRHCIRIRFPVERRDKNVPPFNFVTAAVFLPHDDPSAATREFARLSAKLLST